ncbi:MAG: CBS domain-containing protein [Bacteroidia bacterium]|nr:CBS domain-containing protein [Bacteroidia bacterium]MDW8134944.1 CBS domain-containing protein [Bacteroidia bacterium]
MGFGVSEVLEGIGAAYVAQKSYLPVLRAVVYPWGGGIEIVGISGIPSVNLSLALAGILPNFLLIGFLNFIAWISGGSLIFSTEILKYSEGNLVDIWRILSGISVINGVAIIIKLIPLYPALGGNIVRSFLARFMSYRRATAILSAITMLFSIGAFIYGIFSREYRWVLIIGALFFFLASLVGFVEAFSLFLLKGELKDTPVKQLVMKDYPRLSSKDTLLDAVNMIMNTQAHSFLIMDENQKPVGSLSREDLITAASLFADRNTQLEKIMKRELLIISPQETAQNCLRSIYRQNVPFAVVMENDAVLGIVDRDNILEFSMLGHVLSENLFYHLLSALGKQEEADDSKDSKKDSQS